MMSYNSSSEESPPSFHLREHRSPTVFGKKQILRSKRAPCYDWVFSSATNVHIAIDKSAFRTFTPIESFVLTIADQQRVAVKGIGEVDLKIRCKPGSKDSRIITLENVLYVPDWYCNIFSDVYFQPSTDFEHAWSEAGVLFCKRQNYIVKAWGFTESFCGLERLVLARKLQGRSPMLQDKDREIWSINAHWPGYERHKWHERLAREMQREANKFEAEIKMHHLSQNESEQQRGTHKDHPQSDGHVATPSKITPTELPNSMVTSCSAVTKRPSTISFDLTRATNRVSLGELDQNVPIKRQPSSKIRNLRATLSRRNLLTSLIPSPGRTSSHSD